MDHLLKNPAMSASRHRLRRRQEPNTAWPGSTSPFRLLSSGDMQDVGSDHPVALPLVLTHAGGERPFRINAFVGVCQNICIPFQADLTVDPTRRGSGTDPQVALVKGLKRQVPPGPSGDFRVISHAMQPDLKSLQVRYACQPT